MSLFQPKLDPVQISLSAGGRYLSAGYIYISQCCRYHSVLDPDILMLDSEITQCCKYHSMLDPDFLVLDSDISVLDSEITQCCKYHSMLDPDNSQCWIQISLSAIDITHY